MAWNSNSLEDSHFLLIEAHYLSAFLIALLGAVHCFGMCGGIVAALTVGLPPGIRASFAAMAPFLLAYNTGRILSYGLAGLLAGGIGGWAANLASIHHGQRILQMLAGVFMMMLGLYLADWWRGLARVERFGALFWRRLEGLRRRLIPVRTPAQALALGVVWGWLPCGLVYSVLIWSASAGGAWQGAGLMLSFGLGTLPALLLMGASAATLARLVKRPWVRRAAGTLIIGLGVYQILSLLAPTGY